MNRTLTALAVMSIMSGGAMAQSSVTISGKIDLGVGRSIGSDVNAVQESTAGNSRIAFKGTENLGGGYSAQFGFEHFLRPDVGTQATTRFWAGYSTVGLTTPLGSVNLGRQYSASYSMIQGQIDPFGNVTVANLRDVGMRPGAAVQGLSGSPSGTATVSKVRISDSIRYDIGGKGFKFAAVVGQAAQDGAPGPDRPLSVGANYVGGPLFVGVAYEDPQFENDYQWNAGFRYKVGPATFSAGGAYGRTANNLKVRGALLGLNYSIGSGDLKFGIARSEIGDGPRGVELQRFAVGYHYHLSKRTKIYSDVAHERNIERNKTGADLGILMQF